MSSPSKISAVVISFNGERFIRDCLSSVSAAFGRFPNEILVVDNGSRDRTVQIVKEQFGRIKLLENASNLGFAAAVNQGVRNSDGDIIILLNQDIRARENSIAELTERLLSDSRIGVIGPKFVDFEGRRLKSARAFPRYRDLIFEFTGLSYLFPHSRIFSHWKMGWFDHERELEVDQPMGAALMFRRSLVDEIGFFDEAFPIFFNDVDFCRRVREKGKVNLYYPRAVIEHFVGGSTSIKRRAMIFESHRSMYRYFQKYSRGWGGEILADIWGIILLIAAIVRAAGSFIFRK